MKYLYLNKHWSINKEYNLDKLLYLMIDRPNKINDLGDYVWINNKNQIHRYYDFPSATYHYYNREDIVLYWLKNNKKHRKRSKPAAIYYDGVKGYYMNDNLIKRERSLK